MLKRILNLVLCLILLGAGLLAPEVNGAASKNIQTGKDKVSSSVNDPGTVLSYSGIMSKFAVNEQWMDEQLSKGYTLFQIYTALQQGKENYSKLIEKATPFQGLDDSQNLSFAQSVSNKMTSTEPKALESSDYDQAALSHLELQDDSSLYEIQYDEDSVATATGDLKLRYNDFSLPGALPFNLVRVYDSSRASDEIGVKEENGAFVNQKSSRREEKDSALGRGWRWELPFIEEKGGSKLLDFPGIGRYVLTEDLKLEGYPLKDIQITLDSSKTVEGLTSQFKLSLLNGNNYYFSSSGALILITDNYNNQIELHYKVQGQGTSLSRIVNSDGNELLFEYASGELVVTQKGTDHKMKYIKKEEFGQTVLAESVDALNLKTKYVYSYPESRFNLLKGLVNQEELQPLKSSALLTRVIEPGSGMKEFKYTPARKQIGEYATDFVFQINSRKNLYSTTVGDKVLEPQSFQYSGEDLTGFGQNVNWTASIESPTAKQILTFRKTYHSANQPDVQYLLEQKNIADSVQFKRNFTYDETVNWNKPAQVTESYLQGSSESQPLKATYTYNDQGLILKTSWSTGQEVSNEYYTAASPDFVMLPSQIQTKVDDNRVRVEQYQYNEHGSVIQSEVRENNASGKLLAQTNYDYDVYGNITAVKSKDDKRTKTVNYMYESPYGKQLLTQQSMLVHLAIGGVSEVKQSYDYTPAGEVKTAVDGAGAVTSYTYDSLGRLVKTVYSDQTTESVQYQDELNTVTITGPEGIVTTNQYDPVGLLTRQTVDDAIVQYNYDIEGNLDQLIDAEQNKTQYVYDGFGRLIKTIYADGSEDVTEYDAVNQTMTYRDPSGVKQRQRLDLLGNTVAVEEAKGEDFTVLGQASYDLAGNTVSMTDGNGQKTIYQYDALGRTTAVTDPEQKVTTYTYSLGGDLTKIQYPDKSYIEKEYNEAGQLIRQINEERRVELFYYDSRGNMTKSMDQSSHFTEYQYNSDNLLTLITAPDQQIKYTYDAMGRRSGMEDATGSTAYTYDPADGSLTSIRYPDGTKIDYTYNKQIRNGYTLTDPLGKSVTTKYTLDKLNRVASLDVRSNNSDIRGKAALVSAASLGQLTFDYQPNGLLKSTAADNGVETNFNYDGYDLAGITLSGSALTENTLSATDATYGRSLLSTPSGREFNYQYDPNKNIISRTQNGATSTFTYDALNRIQTEIAGVNTKKYTYDNRGNRLHVEGQRLKGLTSADFTFDSLNRLTKVKGEDGKEVSYTYNGDGLLYERAEGQQKTRYYYDEEAKLIAEVDLRNGKPKLTYIYVYDLSGRLWSRVDQASGEMQYYQMNGHGDIVGLTDSQGKQLNTYSYDIWGNPEIEKETVPNVFRYSGEYWDPTTDLQYLRARWYDPNSGRFISKDTYEGNLDNPLSMNLYTYVENNPLILSDPSGHIPSPAEAAEMASNIYEVTNDDQGTKLSGGWILQKVYTNSESLKIGVYYRINKGLVEYSLVNKGTDIKWNDIVNDVQQPFGYSTDMKDSIKISIGFVKKHKFSEVTFVGHSKGGAEAIANAVATNKNAITFNPAVPKMKQYDLNISSYTGYLRNFVVKGDALNETLGEPSIGKMVYLPTQHKTRWWYAPVYNISQHIKNHKMKAVKSALRKAGYK